jgi:hypothetical protein
MVARVPLESEPVFSLGKPTLLAQVAPAQNADRFEVYKAVDDRQVLATAQVDARLNAARQTVASRSAANVGPHQGR